MPTQRETDYKAMGTEGEQVGADIALAWANSAPLNTVVTQDLAQSIAPVRPNRARFLLHIQNPSAVTAVNIVVRAIELALGGGTKRPQLAVLAVPVSTPDGLSVVFEAPPNVDIRIEGKNGTVLGPADAFSATGRLRRL